MATLSGHLTADFSSFTNAVDQAQISLKGFESDAGKVGSALTRMTESLSGTKVIQEATMMAEAIKLVGGAANLTEQEIAKFNKVAGDAATKLKGMGKDVPEQFKLIEQEARPLPSLFGEVAKVAAGMFTIDAIVGFTKEIITLGGAIKTLAIQTGVTYDEMQQLMYIADQTNTPIEALTKGIQTLQLRLGEPGSGAEAALKRLGISLEDFNKADPQKQLYMVAAALGAITDESKFATEANALFGGSWRTMAPALKSDMEATGKAASLMSKDAVEGLNEFSDGLGSLKNTAYAVAGEVAGAFGDWLFGDYLTETAEKVLDLEDAIKKIPPAWDLAARAGNGVKLSQDELNQILTASNRELTESIKHNKDLKDAQADLASAGTRWTDTVRGMNQETVTAVKGYLEAGVSQRSLATAYTLTQTEIRAVTEALKAEHRAIEMTNRLWGEYNQTVVEQTGTATDAAVADIERWASETARVMREAGADTAEFYDALAEVTHAKMNDILIDWQALGQNSQESYARNLEQIAQKAEATFAYMFDHSDQFSVATIQRFGETAQAARDAANNWRESWVEAGSEATAAVEKTTTETVQSFQRMTSALTGGTTGGRWGQGASAPVPIETGPISFGTLGYAKVFEEYTKKAGAGGGMMGGFIGGGPPTDFLTWALSMGLATRGTTVTNTFNIVDTESGIARRVGDTITSQVQRGSLVN